MRNRDFMRSSQNRCIQTRAIIFHLWKGSKTLTPVLLCIIGKWAFCIASKWGLIKPGILSYWTVCCPWMVETWPPANMTGELDSLVMPVVGVGEQGCRGRTSTLWNAVILVDIERRIPCHLDLSSFALCNHFPQWESTTD